NGHLTFDSSYSSYTPQRFPLYGSIDMIAPFWTDLDNSQTGFVLYNQYTNGSVLQQATRDINSYFPNLNFSAGWVFVATWYEVAYFGTKTTFQAVLISGGQKSFVLMNYGSIASTTLSAGYDTINSFHHFTIPGSFSSSATGDNSAFSLSSNVNVTGRWAFQVDSGVRVTKLDCYLYCWTSFFTVATFKVFFYLFYIYIYLSYICPRCNVLKVVCKI
uniref:NIDO domain-containing protein n=1 Tax=Oryzias sinensis TaxID=183150 RepID=A0A8C7WRW8_9TELE